MQSSLISVIIPTYERGERLLRAAIDSVLAQDVGSLEVIVVDDGSAISAEQVVASYGDTIRFHHKPNGGIGSARNAGVALSHGDMLAFLDSDDVWEPDKLGRQLKALGCDPGLEAAFGRAEQFYDAELDAAFKLRHPIKEHVVDAWLSSAMLIRKEAFDRIGPYDEELAAGNDIDWWLRAREAGLRVTMLPHVVYRRRIHTGNSSITDSERTNQARLVALKRSLDRRRASKSQD